MATQHSNQTEIHRLENWVYADAAARTGASGFTSLDLGKIAYQTDTGTYYRLTATTPVWAAFAAVEIAADVYNSANISVAHATIQFLTFDSERFDTDGIHSTSSNTSRLTCTKAGKYLIEAAIEYAANATGIRGIGLRLNGDNAQIIHLQKNPNCGAGESSGVFSSRTYQLVVGDYVEVVAYQTSGGALDVLVGGKYSPTFSMIRISGG